jgi:hypothetical protein
MSESLSFSVHVSMAMLLYCPCYFYVRSLVQVHEKFTMSISVKMDIEWIWTSLLLQCESELKSVRGKKRGVYLLIAGLINI